MPTRLLREGILTSERVNELDFPAEVFYRRLMSKVDDHGLFDARLSVLRASLYPLKVDRVREADISRWMAACQKAGLIVLYEADNKHYLRMLDTNWQVRSEPKYPLPTDSDCKQPLAPVYLDVVEDEVIHAHEQAFDRFWSAYPRKVGKGRALQVWKRQNLDNLLDQILSTLSWQVHSNQWRSEGGKFIPHPTTWLNGKCWLDEPLGRKQSAVVKGSDGKEYDLPEVAL